MTFFNPIWLILLLPLSIPLLLWRPPSKSVLFLRILMLLLIVLAMAGLAVKLPRREGTVIAIIDRSKSMPNDAYRIAQDALQVIEKSRKGDNRLGIISFSEKAGIEKMPGNRIFDGLKIDYQGDQSNLDSALETALSLIPDNTPGRIILLSDGAWTGKDPSGEFARCAARGIPVDYRLFGNNKSNDLAIKDVFAPYITPTSEFYTVQVEIKSPSAREAGYVVRRNRQVYLKGKLKLSPGINRFVFRDRSLSPQTIRYSLELTDSGTDPCQGNNRANFMVRVRGKRPILLVTGNKESGLGKVLRGAGLNVEVKLPHEVEFSLRELNGYCGIILENITASSIGGTGMATIAQLVRKSGTGLMITGGDNSYGLGGYYKSPLEDILPVSMELRREHRKLSMAIVLVLDRSGSMTAGAGAGRTKMDLANIASVEVLNILTQMDSIGVIAVDSAPHIVVPLCPVKEATARKDEILHIQSMGGGIYVFNGLAAAGKMLAGSRSGTRHIILFADAADAEQPGAYRELLKKFRESGITVSVIGLGQQTDCDANFLKDVAKRGGGRCFFTSQAVELPRLFTQDAFVVARNTFVKDKTKVKFTGAFQTVGTRSLGNSFTLGGYNLCYTRPGARVGAVTEDEYKAPVIAFWQAELGRVICFTGDVDGKYSGAFGKWQNAAKLLTDMATWSSGDKQAMPDGMLITQDIQNGVHRIRLHLNPERKQDPFKTRPEIITLSGMPGRKPGSSTMNMRWASPDMLVAEIPLKSTEVSLSTVRIANLAPQVLAPVTLPYSPEYKPSSDTGSRSSVKTLCKLSGGKQRVDLAAIWNDLPALSRLESISSWLLVAAVIVLLLEVLQRRTGMLFKWLPNGGILKMSREQTPLPVSNSNSKRSPAKSSTTIRTPKKQTDKNEPQDKSENKIDHQVLSAFQKAKK